MIESARIESARLQRTSLTELRSQFRTEQIASWTAAAGVVVLALVFDQPWGVLLGAGVGLMAIVRLPSFAAIDREDVVAAMWWEAAGTWGISLIVVGAIPDATPIMVLNLLGPLVTGAVYLDARQMRRLISAGVVVAVALGVLGFRSEGTGIEDAMPEWLFQIIMILYLVSHVIVMSASLSAANRVRLATLDAVVAANEALTLSDADLRESRRRVISAGDRERVRIERNIHDGAQQGLVALAVQLRLASQLARSGTPVTADQLDAMHAESREALEELRELARGIYPSVLTERGLEDALRAIGHRSPNHVEIAYDCAEELSSEEAAAIYFVCLEALQNVAKHAGTRATARVALDPLDDVLIVSIIDDGIGCDPATIGSSRGVLNMVDRARALGGELTVDSAPGTGTRVRMVLPHRSAANVGP
jgi:signal transduction histidine kinase